MSYKKILCLIVGIIVLALLACACGKNESADSSPAVLTVGDHKVTATEFCYFYHAVEATCEYYAANLGIDSDIALNEQKVDSSDLGMTDLLGIDTSCLESLTPIDGVYDFTWSELIAHNAMRKAASAYAIYFEAEKAGFKLDEDALFDIDASVAEIESIAESNGMTVSQYYSLTYAEGCDEDGYRQYLTVTKTAAEYPKTITFSEIEKADRNALNPNDFDTVAFYYYRINASAIKDEAEYYGEYLTYEEMVQKVTEEYDYDTINLVDPLTYYDAIASEAAITMSINFAIHNKHVAVHADYSREYLESMFSVLNLPADSTEWFFTASEGETKLFKQASDDEYAETDYIVVKIIDRKNYRTANYLSFRIKEYENGEYLPDSAAQIASVQASLQADHSEENFCKLIAENTGLAIGAEYDYLSENLSENQTRYTAANVSKEFFAWLMMQDRAYGDWTMVQDGYGTTFYFYYGEGQHYRDMCIEYTLLNEWYDSVTADAIQACEYNADLVSERCNIKFY